MKIFTEDIQIARALINRDNLITKKFFYVKCYPLFKSIYDKYYTDCVTCKEFIDEIYILVLSPSKRTGRCQLENFKGESTLASWLKSACLYYCYAKYERKPPIIEPICNNNDSEFMNHDSFLSNIGSCNIDLNSIDRMDAEKILS